MEKLLKFTFHGDADKLHVYLKMPSPIFSVLKQEIEMSLFQQRQLPYKELRAYWIDEDGDEIDIINQCDYEVFLAKFPSRQHLQVCYKVDKAEQAKANADKPPADDPAAFVIHDRVECDSCNVSPIIGFRYKCIQCPNYDLCQRCEAKHKHVDHMMIRMPMANSPTVVESWISGGPSGRRRPHRHCPFVNVTTPVNAAQTDDAPESHRHHRRSHRNQMRRQGLFSHLFDIMNDLAEGGTTARDQKEASDEKASQSKENNSAKTADARAEAATEAEAAKIAAAAASKAAEAAHVAATDAAHKAATAAAQAAVQLNGLFNCPVMTPNNNKKVEAAQDNDKKSEDINMNKNPKTPPPTPTTASTDPIANGSTNPEVNVPVLDFNNIAKFIDPETMKTGIQILNNFSDMFMKMVDPANGGDAAECPLLNIPSRKSSTNSTGNDDTASTSASSIRSSVSTKESSPIQTVEKPETAVEAAKLNNDKPSVPEKETTGNLVTIENEGSDCESEQSENNRWQLVDPPSTSSPQQSSTPNKDINYNQLSKDLKAHVDEERKREAENKQKAENMTAAAAANATATVATETAATETDSVAAAVNTATNIPSAPAEDTRARIVYHSNQRIDSAVHAMMAMGFSNEGAWLTQLLESVNGNISEALDLMSAAQRNQR